MPPGPRSVGCERVTDPRGQPDPAKPHCGFWCATGPAPMAHRGLGVLWGCGGAQGVAMWWATRLVTGVRPSPRWGRFVTPVTANGGCEPLQRPGVVPRCRTHPGGCWGGSGEPAWLPWPLNHPSDNFLASLIAKGTAGTRAGAGGPPDGAPLAELGNDRPELVLASDAFSAAKARAPSACTDTSAHHEVKRPNDSVDAKDTLSTNGATAAA